uniref:F-box domain-containing protein n=1 Tax=Steinernema glaseri TaxID=37863 RepID=A0A1I7ZI34_9BILA
MLEVFKTRLHKASRNSEDSSVTWTQKKKGPLKDSEEWKKKKSRILSKMRALGKINLALIIARMPFKIPSHPCLTNEQLEQLSDTQLLAEISADLHNRRFTHKTLVHVSAKRYQQISC